MFYRSLSACNVDTHWLPLIARCGHCSIPYNVVGKLETIQQDLFFIGRMVGVNFSDSAVNPSSGGDTSSLAREYFSMLDKKIIKQLYNSYRMDFELFGYSPNGY